MGFHVVAAGRQAGELARKEGSNAGCKGKDKTHGKNYKLLSGVLFVRCVECCGKCNVTRGGVIWH